MSIRKTGQTGTVTGVEGTGPEAIRRTAAGPWDERDDQALAEENTDADAAGDDG
jgi:hypothetical protein